jgi:hypothetical protein
MNRQSDMLPNFFIVGAMKAGTTSLYNYLDQHPQVYMSPLKEPCYFSSETRPENMGPEFQEPAHRGILDTREYIRGPMTEKRLAGLVVEWEDYVGLFRHVKQETAIGEASIRYLWSKMAPENIRSRIPTAKIIIVLRDPADRAFSEYHYAVTNGVVPWSFGEHIDRALHLKSDKLGLLYPFLEYGLYYEQVKRYLNLFPRDNVRVYLYEDYTAQFPRLWRDVLGFLQVDASFSPDTTVKHMEPRVPRLVAASHVLKKYGIWPRLTKLTPRAIRPALRSMAFRRRNSLVMNSNDRQRLIAYYQEDVRKLSALMNRDLSAWLV